MRCEEATEHLSAYLDGEISAELEAAVKEHLDGCVRCRTLLEELRATVSLLGSLPALSAPDHLAADVQRELERRAVLPPALQAAELPHERSLPLRRDRLLPRVLALAAALLLAAGIGLLALVIHTYQAPTGSMPDVGAHLALQPTAAEADKSTEEMRRNLAHKPPTRPARPADRSALADLTEKLELQPEQKRDEGPLSLALTSPAAEFEEPRKRKAADETGLAKGPSAEELAKEPAAATKHDDAGRSVSRPRLHGEAAVGAGAVPDRLAFGDTGVGKAVGRTEEGGGTGQPGAGPAMFGFVGGKSPPAAGQERVAEAPRPQTGADEKNRSTSAGVPLGPSVHETKGPAELQQPAPLAAEATASAPAAPAAARPAAPKALEPAPAAAAGESAEAVATAATSPVVKSRLAEPAAASQHFAASGVATGQAIRLAGPLLVQQVMNSVAGGEAPIEQLRSVANRANLLTAENQLVVTAPSRGEANRALERLFLANGWQGLTAGQKQYDALERSADKQRADGTATFDRPGQQPLTATGLYYLADQNGEDTWLVITDRDSLSRFGSQLAQAEQVTVAMDSSAEFRAIGLLQRQLRQYGTTAAANGAATLQKDTGRSVASGGGMGGQAGARETYARRMKAQPAEATEAVAPGPAGPPPAAPAKAQGKPAASPASPETVPDDVGWKLAVVGTESRDEPVPDAGRTGAGGSGAPVSAGRRAEGVGPASPSAPAAQQAGAAAERGALRLGTGPAPGAPSGEYAAKRGALGWAEATGARPADLAARTAPVVPQAGWGREQLPANQVLLVIRVRPSPEAKPDAKAAEQQPPARN